MNGIKPNVDIEFDDKYINAKNRLIGFLESLNELTDIQRVHLAQEFVTSYGLATSFEQFISYINYGGKL